MLTIFEFRFAVAIGRLGGLITVWDKGLFMANSEFCGNRFILFEYKWVREGLVAVLYMPPTIC